MNSLQMRSRFQLPEAKTLSDIVHSVVGQIEVSLAMEAAGSWGGRKVVQCALERLGAISTIEPSSRDRWVALSAEIMCLAIVLKRTKNLAARAALATLLASNIVWLSSEQARDPQMFVNIQYITNLFAENLGGFLGMAAAALLFKNEPPSYWDSDEPQRCYLKRCACAQLTGGVYDAFVNPEVPFLLPAAFLGKFIAKETAYYADLIVPWLIELHRSILNNKAPNSVLESLFVRVIADRVSYYFPLSFSDICKKSSAVSHLLNTIRLRLGDIQKKEILAIPPRIFLKELQEYFQLIRRSSVIQLAQRNFLQDSNPSTELALRQLLGGKGALEFSSTAKLLLQEIVQEEKRMFGVQMLQRTEQTHLEKFLNIHLQAFCQFALGRLAHLDFEQFRWVEEVQLMADMGHFTLSVYLTLILPPSAYHRAQQFIDATYQGAQEVGSSLQDFMYRTQQRKAIEPDKKNP